MKKLALAAGLIILLIVLIAIAGFIVLSYQACTASGGCLLSSSCSSDSDCVLAYAGETACGSCNQMGPDYKCVSPLEAEILQQKRLLQWGGSLPKCGVCLSNAECVCTGGKCEKIPRTIVEKCNQNSDCVLGYSEGGCSCNQMGENFKCVSPQEADRMKAEWYSKKIACEKCLPEEVVGAECICSSGE